MAYVERINGGKHTIPTIAFPEGSTLIEPSTTEFAERLGQTATANRTFYDLVIAGAGPAGFTAAICGCVKGWRHR